MVTNGILIRVSTQYSYDVSTGGIILTLAKDDDFSEKKYRLGEVISKGDNVPDAVQVGDILVYLTASAYRMPNGHDEAQYFKLTYNDMSVMGVLPNLDPAKRAAKWNSNEFIGDIEAESEQWKTGVERPR